MSWEFQSEKEMYTRLVGSYCGDDSDLMRSRFKSSRKKTAQLISRLLNLKTNEHVLEIGSGIGEMARLIAPSVRHLVCADVSTSFLSVAKEKCRDIENISFHKIDFFNFDFLKNESLDAIYSHAVFIHLNIYDVLLYFKNFHRILKVEGKVYIDFLSADHATFDKSSVALEHMKYYEEDKSVLPSLVSYHGEKAIVRAAKSFGFDVLFKFRAPHQTILLVLEKGSPERSFYETLRLLYRRLKCTFRFIVSKPLNSYWSTHR